MWVIPKWISKLLMEKQLLYSVYLQVINDAFLPVGCGMPVGVNPLQLFHHLQAKPARASASSISTRLNGLGNKRRKSNPRCSLRFLRNHLADEHQLIACEITGKAFVPWLASLLALTVKLKYCREISLWNESGLHWVVLNLISGFSGLLPELSVHSAWMNPMIPREQLIGNFPPKASFSQAIFNPTNTRIVPSAYLSR